MSKDFEYRGFDVAIPPSVEQNPEWNLDYLESLQTELDNRLYHLKRSQSELEEALQQDPDDEDFKEAHEENRSVIERTEKRLKEVAESIARIKYVDDSGYWTNETFSTPNKRPPEYSAEMAGNISNNVTLPSSITQAAESNPGESKDNDRSDDKEETKDGSLEL
eukprot:gb/GECG01012305.1/.p1 GENE.gb/GECG01012305.1/~~gb/GECG01012305.1/.p1  ORF type:complete len:164 (+),score=37.58 gb/GECG01012305.1/:1-492(+)